VRPLTYPKYFYVDEPRTFVGSAKTHLVKLVKIAERELQ